MEIAGKETGMDYKKAGVDIEAGYKSVELMKEHVKRTIKRWRSRFCSQVQTDAEPK